MDDSPRTVAERYWAAEATRDVDQVLATYDPAATFHPVTGPLVGHDEIRTFYEGMGDTFPGLEFEIVHEVSNDTEASLEWEAVLIDHDGNRYPIRGVNVLEVRGGKVVNMRAYYDPTQFPTPKRTES